MLMHTSNKSRQQTNIFGCKSWFHILQKGSRDTSLHLVSNVFGRNSLQVTWVKCLRRMLSCCNSRGVYGASSHKVYRHHMVPFCTLSHSVMGWADGQPLPTQHQHAMVKWQQPDTKMKQINNGVSYGDDQTTAHDTVHKCTQALSNPQRGASFNECRLVRLTNHLIN